MSSAKSPSSSPSPKSSSSAGPCVKFVPRLQIKLLDLPAPHGPPPSPPKVSSPLLNSEEEGYYSQDASVPPSKIPKDTYISSGEEEVLPPVSEKTPRLTFPAASSPRNGVTA